MNTPALESKMLLKTARPVGIVGYGAYLPRYRIKAEEIARVWAQGNVEPPVREKSVPGLDEDTVTIALEAARNALARARIDPGAIKAVWVGSESHPYAVKPTGTIVAEALGATPYVQAADWEFACKAGTEALQAAMGFVGSGMADYALIIGADTAQGRPGDALDYTAAAGGAAFIIGPAQESLAIIEASCSYVTDTPDFFRRSGMNYPSHGARFTGEPAYFHHIEMAARTLMEKTGYKPQDFAYAVFHQPNLKFPQTVAKRLGFAPEQIRDGLLVGEIGNTYAASSLIGLTAVLDIAKPGERILLVSFGSGAGSDSFSILTTEKLPERQPLAPSTRSYIMRRKEVDYALYARFRKLLEME